MGDAMKLGSCHILTTSIPLQHTKKPRRITSLALRQRLSYGRPWRNNYVNLHVYYYAGNNPVRYTDPDGMDDEPSGPPPSNIPETGSEGGTGAFN